MMFKRLLSVTVKPGVDHIDWIIWHLYSPESDPSPPNKHKPSPLSCYPHHRHTCRQTQAMTKLYHHYYLTTTATECEHKQTSCERKCLCLWVRFVQPPEGGQLKAIFFVCGPSWEPWWTRAPSLRLPTLHHHLTCTALHLCSNSATFSISKA